MIELPRYAELNPRGLARVEPHTDRPDHPVEERRGLNVIFKRHDVSDGHEIEPEVSFVSFEAMEEHLRKLEIEKAVLVEFLTHKKG